jgi:hypothetical protein
VNEAKQRQQSLLLDDRPDKTLPKELEEKVFELLVQMLLVIVPANNGGKRDEQDHA